MYIAKEELTFAEVEAGVVKAIRKLAEGIGKGEESVF
jgi:hypothetical protein